jgi:hypothetical protein
MIQGCLERHAMPAIGGDGGACLDGTLAARNVRNVQ